MLTVAELMAECWIFDGLRRDHLELVAACGELTRFPAGAALFLQGQPADRFYVIRSGTVALQAYAGGRGALTIQTLHAGDSVGWSWLFPPYRWQLDAMAQEPVAAIAFEATCLRTKSLQDHELGYQLMSRFAQRMLEALIATRMQLLDVYNGHDRR